MFGLNTVRDGNRVAVWKPNGTQQLIDGPTRFFNVLGKIIPLKRYTAEPDEYLAVRFKDGHTEHRRGPATEWLDPVTHREIEIKKGLPVDANEAVVVYLEKNGEVTRRIERGPALLVLEANEWLHEFRWHGSDPKRRHIKIPRGLIFKKLRVIPDQLYFDVLEVRTNDEAMLTIKIMVFFELVDIDLMLNRTHDPVADFINALTADIIEFVGKANFEKFKEGTEELNNIATYPQLVQRAEGIGYKMNKVVYRGYHANDKLQAMHDNAIETRTKLILDGETEEQAQELEDLKLDREIQRDIQMQKQAVQTADHERKLKRMTHEETLRQQREEHEAAIQCKKELNELKRKQQEAVDVQKVKLLDGMADLKVDLTQVLVAENKNPDKLIRIDTENEPPQFHLHEA